MTEQDFEKSVAEIKGDLKAIKQNTRSPLWRSFLTGTLSGLGSVIGVAIALAIVGWVLNVIGIIPAFRGEVVKLNQTLESLRQNK